MDLNVMNGLLTPKSVAIVGASATPGKIGHTVVKNLIDSKYEGKIYPINPKSDEILGLKCYHSVSEVAGDIDAAIITVPAVIVLDSIKECGEKGVKGAIIITSGFSEVGKKDLEKELVETANSYGMRILGPNIVGVLSNSDKFNGSFAPFLPFNGSGSLVSQSGALLIGIDASTYLKGVGFDKLISIGNMSDVNFADTIEWLDQDEDTKCISLYIEGFKQGRRVIEAAKKATKPIIGLKSGISAHGAAAAASHTGSLAGAAKVYQAAFKQAGIIWANDLNNLFDRTLALSMQPPMKGDNLLIITNGGGVGVLATDAAEKYGIPLKFAPDDVQVELKKHMPEFGSAKNPVDLTGMAGTEWYYDSVKYAIQHPWVDGVVVLYCETAMTNPIEIAEGIQKAVKESGVTDKPVTVSYVGGENSEKAMKWLVENGIPAYNAPDLAVNTIAALREFALNKENIHNNNVETKSYDKKRALEVIQKARDDGRNALTEIEAKQIFEAYQMPVTHSKVAKSEDEAVEFAEKIGYPIVMKIVSPQILHKSDAGGVKVNIKDEAGVRSAYNTILKNARAYKSDAVIHGILVQEMAPMGTEVILGSVNDATFGPTVMFGLGGIFVEVLKDVTFRVAPFSKKQALEMMSEIKGAPILQGVRGEKPRDLDVMADTVVNYANMVLDLADEVSESDANPVLLYEQGKGLKIADARMILKKK